MFRKGGIGMESLKVINFNVYCPGDNFKIEPMQVILRKVPQGWFPECNGCENMNGSMPCDLCRRDLMLMFMHHPDMNTLEPITPALPEEEKDNFSSDLRRPGK